MLKKHLSQTFLIDDNIIRKIIEKIDIKNGDNVLEIGPGKGALSEYLISITKNLILVEIDNNFTKFLRNDLKYSQNKIYSDDILTFDFTNIISEYIKFRIIGNIPYKISTRLILHLSNFKEHIHDIHFVVQEEVSKKFLNTTKSKESYASLLIQYHFDIEKQFKIYSKSFIPKPKIDSALIKIKPKVYKKTVLNYIYFESIVKKAFTQKRQKISKSINTAFFYKKYINIEKDAIKTSLSDYIRLSNLLFINKID